MIQECFEEEGEVLERLHTPDQAGFRLREPTMARYLKQNSIEDACEKREDTLCSDQGTPLMLKPHFPLGERTVEVALS